MIGSRLSKIIEEIFHRAMEARIDIKNKGIDGNDLVLTNISDENCIVSSPAWFSKVGIGYSLRSVAGNIRFSVKFIKNGTFNIFLHTEPCANNDVKKTKIPVFIDYDYLTINGRVIFCEKKATWHDEWFLFEQSVKDGEEMTIEIGWSPHLCEKEKFEIMLDQLLEKSLINILPPQNTFGLFWQTKQSFRSIF